MIHDARESLPSELEADVCIVGAGPAGIVLALELAKHGREVVIIEGGGLDGPGEGQSLYAGESTGRKYPLAGSRLRWLGGTSNHWGGWVKPLDPLDFVDKPHYPMPTWPFGLDALAPWYSRAAHWCELESDVFDVEAAGFARRPGLFPADRLSGFADRLFRFSPPTRFGTRYREALIEAESIDCRVNLNAVSLVQQSDHVRAVEARTLHGARTRIRASHFVLATGGIENARFLLNQDAVPGNGSGLVGACFMDHYGFSPGHLLAPSGLGYERGAIEGEDVMLVMTPSREMVFDENLRNSCILVASASDDTTLPAQYLDSPLFRPRGEGAGYRVGMINEPMPYRESCVSLADTTDALGLRRARLNWHLPESEFQPVLALFRRWMSEISASGLGRIKWDEKRPRALDEHVGIGYHHMGTTRMSASAEYGVVDRDSRCWDRDNLYMAGSSVFPMVGYSNPTLTIVALAARLAEHLDRRLGAG